MPSPLADRAPTPLPPNLTSPTLTLPIVLPARHRMRRSADFTSAVRAGRRARRGTVVVHHSMVDHGTALPGPARLSAPAAGPMSGADAALVGLVVNKAVGGSVVRHRVARRLRAQLAARLDQLPAGSRTVVRALPEAATASSARLGADLDLALARVVR